MHVYYAVKYDVGNCNLDRSAVKRQVHVGDFHSSSRAVVCVITC